MNTRIFCNGKTALKKFMIPTACSAAAAVITTSTDKKETSEPPKIRPSELPIYSKEPAPPPKCDPHLSSDSVLYSSVRQIRKCIWTLIDEGKLRGQQACDYLETGKARTASTLAFLREEENRVPRYGAIGIGGLAGLVLALRRGRFKKLLYTTAGATAMAALCYPKEAEQYTSEGLKLVKQYIVIGYHFVNGVLRDYAGVQLPALPKPLSSSNSSETVSGNEASVAPSNTSSASAATPSHSQLGPIPMPPIDIPPNVTDADSKPTRTKRENRDQSNPDDRDLYAKRG